MKFKKRMIPKPSLKLTNVIERLTKESINYEEFLDLLNEASDTFFDNPELELELLVSNGLPIEFDAENNVYLKTAHTTIEDQTFCIVDIETNGSSVNKGFQIIELGAVKYKNGEIVDKFESLVYAKVIPEYIQEVTNIKPSMLEDAPIIDTVLKEFKLFLEDDVFVAHNIKFDYEFISDSFEKYDLGKLQNRRLCTIDLARRTIESEKYGLRALKETLEIEVDNHHRAYYDALATTYILEESIKNLNRDVVQTAEDLIKFSFSSKTKQIRKPKVEKTKE